MGTFDGMRFTTAIILLFLLSFFCKDVLAQEFYLNNSSKITTIFRPIQSNWIDINLNESHAFLKNSGLSKIDIKSAGDKEYITGSYSYENYVFRRTLIFKDKLIVGYYDTVDFLASCLYCFSKDLLRRSGGNSVLQDLAKGNMAENKQKDNVIKDLVLSKFNALCAEDGLYNLEEDISSDLYDVKKSNYIGDFKVVRNCKVEIEDNQYMFHLSKIVALNEEDYLIGQYDLKKVDTYDLYKMIEIFLLDCKLNGINLSKSEVDAKFEQLDGDIIGLSYAKDNDQLIEIKIDPRAWSASSKPKRWYLLYHELGHDVLNFEHGNGGEMMFNFADRGYSWNEFWEDKSYMLKRYLAEGKLLTEEITAEVNDDTHKIFGLDMDLDWYSLTNYSSITYAIANADESTNYVVTDCEYYLKQVDAEIEQLAFDDYVIAFNKGATANKSGLENLYPLFYIGNYRYNDLASFRSEGFNHADYLKDKIIATYGDPLTKTENTEFRVYRWVVNDFEIIVNSVQSKLSTSLYYAVSSR